MVVQDNYNNHKLKGNGSTDNSNYHFVEDTVVQTTCRQARDLWFIYTGEFTYSACVSAKKWLFLPPLMMLSK